MSKEINKDELIKALMSDGLFSKEEAEELIKSNSSEEEEGDEKEVIDNSTPKKGEKDDEYSEEKEEELKKTMEKAKEEYDSYRSKSSKIEKSEKNLISESKTNEIIEKSISEGLNTIEKSYQEKLKDIENSFNEKFEKLSKSIDNIGNVAPDFKSIDRQAIIEKSFDGIKQDGKIFYSKSIHKEQIGDLLYKCLEEEKGNAIEKSLDVDLSNFVSGFGEISKETLNYLDKEKNIVIK